MNHHKHPLARGIGRFGNAIAAAIPLSHSNNSITNRCQPLFGLPSALTSTSTLDAATDAQSSDRDSDAETGLFVGTMGKSNKFDYTNRTSTGPKLGSIIGRDLEKEAEKVIRDAEKQASKARKVSTGSAASTSSASIITQEAVVHVLDLKVPGRQLNDEGACAMAAGLETALRKGTNEACVLLEDLNLSDNELTTKSLARLAPVIDSARHDLKTLNLANNNIKVETPEEAAEWQTFLEAFRWCLKLRRLDLSGNQGLGPMALEVLAKVHSREAAVQPTSASGTDSVHSLEDDDNEPTPRATAFDGALAGACFIKRRCGLRSIPYLTLNDIGLNEAGALWLSYVIVDHHYPGQLIDELNATQADTLIKTYQQTTYSGGIDYNEPSSGDGLRLLKKAEEVRKQVMLADQLTLAGSVVDAASLADGEDLGTASGRTSFALDRGHSRRASRGDRRASIRSIRTNDGGEHELSELESLRKKVQRAVIDKFGAASVELWRSGLQIATATRTLQGVGPQNRDMTLFYTGPPMFNFLTPTKDPRCDNNSRPVTPLNATKFEQVCSDSGRSSPSGHRKQGTYAARLTANTGAAPGEPELAITEVTNSPATPKKIFKPHRKGAFSEGGDLQSGSLMHKLEGLQIVRDSNPQRFVRWQEKLMAGETQSHCFAGQPEKTSQIFRDPDVPSHLPPKVLEKIALSSVSEREGELLSEKQKQKVLQWGVGGDRAKVAEMEREWRKMADSAQVWLLLESLGCLEYQRK